MGSEEDVKLLPAHKSLTPEERSAWYAEIDLATDLDRLNSVMGQLRELIYSDDPLMQAAISKWWVLGMHDQINFNKMWKQTL